MSTYRNTFEKERITLHNKEASEEYLVPFTHISFIERNADEGYTYIYLYNYDGYTQVDETVQEILDLINTRINEIKKEVEEQQKKLEEEQLAKQKAAQRQLELLKKK